MSTEFVGSKSYAVLNALGMAEIANSAYGLVAEIRCYVDKSKSDVMVQPVKRLLMICHIFHVRRVEQVKVEIPDFHRVLRTIGKELIRLCENYYHEANRVRRQFITLCGLIRDGEERMAARIRPILEIRDAELVEKGEKLVEYCRQLVILIRKLENFEAMQAILDDETETVDIPEIEAGIRDLSNRLAAEIEVDLDVLLPSTHHKVGSDQ